MSRETDVQLVSEGQEQLPETTVIPVCRPLLPDVDRLSPYLRRIDSNRVYSNWGPLVTEFQTRLASHFGRPDGSVVSAASGTAALVGGILAVAGRATIERPLALIPAFTFVATALAAEACGYRPCFVDVNPDNWLLDADLLERHPMLDSSGVVIPVAAFGRGVDQQPWVRFQHKTGIPVLIDGGASFEAVTSAPDRHLGAIPVTLSFHATKSFSTGEGGCVIAEDAVRAASILTALNFGFFESRDCGSAAINGKMSEYHAAVGLAELDGWESKHEALLSVASAYYHAFAAANLADRLTGPPSVASCYSLFRCRTAEDAEERLSRLALANIETRRWYGFGAHRHSGFASLRPLQCEHAVRIAGCTIGLPVASDLSPAAISRVARAFVT